MESAFSRLPSFLTLTEKKEQEKDKKYIPMYTVHFCARIRIPDVGSYIHMYVFFSFSIYICVSIHTCVRVCSVYV